MNGKRLTVTGVARTYHGMTSVILSSTYAVRIRLVDFNKSRAVTFRTGGNTFTIEPK